MRAPKLAAFVPWTGSFMENLSARAFHGTRCSRLRFLISRNCYLDQLSLSPLSGCCNNSVILMD